MTQVVTWIRLIYKVWELEILSEKVISNSEESRRQVQWRVPVISAPWEAEAGKLLNLGVCSQACWKSSNEWEIIIVTFPLLLIILIARRHAMHDSRTAHELTMELRT